MTTEEVVERLANARPGFVLASYAEVGLPFYRIRLRLQLLERKPVGPLEEYSLRAVRAGVADPDDMQAALGLEPSVLDATILGLVERDALLIAPGNDPGSEKLTLTAHGQDVLEQVQQIVARERVVDIDFDGLLREPTPFLARYLEPRELDERGIREIPPHPPKRPDEMELRAQVPRIAEIVRQLGGPRQQISDVLAVRGIERRLRIFQPAIALVYRAEGSSRSQGQVAFAVGGQLSERHGEVFAAAGLGQKLGLAKRGIEDARKVAARVLGDELVERLETSTTSRKQPVDESTSAGPKSPADAVDEGGVRAVETYQHPAILADALETSRHRLLLISPWVRRAVVDEQFLSRLANALDRGVEIFLGWGMSASETASPDADPDVLASLTELSGKYHSFHFKRLGRTHAKVLICDQRFIVVTSFNWLSFRGDPKRTFRDERGTLVALPTYVDAQFEDWRSRFL